MRHEPTGGHISGVLSGIIRDTADPMNLKRVRLEIPHLYGEDLSNWSFPSAPAQIGQPPSITVPAVGTAVWVMFENGDPDIPVWISG